MPNSKLFILAKWFFVVLGILSFGVLIHEGVHVLQSKNPESICLDLNVAYEGGIMLTHVSHIPWADNDEMSAWKVKTEFCAYAAQFIITGLLICGIAYHEGKEKGMNKKLEELLLQK
ncbi:hypothetical protein D1BOALGB6SA_4986 [Olavius sp. associated proteobacterium Delta 1]|nr:hypothetical protein D1BOALGB6SA_4986 [Olavius sp. associated proteobacterium Delta 1]